MSRSLTAAITKSTNSIRKAPALRYAFTIKVDLAPPHDYDITNDGNKRYIPITGGTVDGPKLQGEILPGGGDWNTVQHNGVVHVCARDTQSEPRMEPSSASRMKDSGEVVRNSWAKCSKKEFAKERMVVLAGTPRRVRSSRWRRDRTIG